VRASQREGLTESSAPQCEHTMSSVLPSPRRRSAAATVLNTPCRLHVAQHTWSSSSFCATSSDISRTPELRSAVGVPFRSLPPRTLSAAACSASKRLATGGSVRSVRRRAPRSMRIRVNRASSLSRGAAARATAAATAAFRPRCASNLPVRRASARSSSASACPKGMPTRPLVGVSSSAAHECVPCAAVVLTVQVCGE
jgi:hypothetical protein